MSLGVMLMPMLFSTVCGNMVRNDLERSDTAYTVHVTIQREGIRGEKYLVSIVSLCARGRAADG